MLLLRCSWCVSVDGDLTRVGERIRRHVTRAALQADCFEQTTQAVRRSLVEIEIFGTGRTSGGKPRFEVLLIRQREPRNGA